MRPLVCLALGFFAIWCQQAQAGNVIAWVSDTAYVVFDGTAEANIVGSGVVASGSKQIAYGKPEIEAAALVNGKGVALGATQSQISATVSAISAALGAAASTAGSCAGGGWLAAAGCFGLNLIVQAAVALGVDALVHWLFGPGSSSTPITVSQPLPGTLASGFYWSGPVWTAANTGGNTSSSPGTVTMCSTDPAALEQAILNGLNEVYKPYTSKAYSYTQSTFSENNASSASIGGASYTDVVLGGLSTTYPNSFTVGMTYYSTCTAAQILAPLSGDTLTGIVSVGTAVSDIPSSELSQGVAPQTTADLINGAWQQAASQSGYSGIPYPSSDPIQASDVSTWESNNPSFAPTVGDDVGTGSGVGSQGNAGSSVGSLPGNGTASDGTGPGSSGGTSSTGTTGTSTGASGTTGTSTGTSTGASGATGSSSTSDPDFCSLDPTASACASLGTVTAGTLPASSVAISLSPWSIGPSGGACPAPVTVSVFGATLTFSYQPVCTFAQMVQPLVLALCALAAAFIVVMGFK